MTQDFQLLNKYMAMSSLMGSEPCHNIGYLSEICRKLKSYKSMFARNIVFSLQIIVNFL